MANEAAKLKRLAKAGDAQAGGASQASRDITAELRRLQNERRSGVDVLEIVEALAPTVSRLVDGDFLVSLARTRDGRSVRMSVLVGKSDWVEFYVWDADAALETGEGVRAALGLPL